MTETVLISRAEVVSLCAGDGDHPGIDVEDALRTVLVQAERGAAGQTTRTELAPPDLPGVLGIMPGYRVAAPAVFAAKVVCVVPGNAARGLPPHQGVVLLFDAGSGALLALAEAGAVTEIRTAALTALATRTLAGTGHGTSLVIGGGHQAAAHLRALSRLPAPLAVWTRRPERARAISDRLAAEGIAVAMAPDLERAVRGAAVVTTVTSAPEPILRDEWLAPGALVNAIGSSTPRVCEISEATVRGAFLVSDDPDAVLDLAGEFARLAPPVPRPVSLGSLLGADPPPVELGRRRTVFKSVGVPLQDLALMSALLEAANARGTGRRLTL